MSNVPHPVANILIGDDWEDVVTLEQMHAHAAAPDSQWMPIETAPKDVTILLYGAKRLEMCVGMHHSRDGWVTDTTSEWMSMYPPTHWMPLPAAPAHLRDAVGRPQRSLAQMPTPSAHWSFAMPNDTKPVWVAYTNTDCTEGRGYDVPIAVCAAEITAMRLARKQYVQGSDGPVRRVEMLQFDGKWYVPAHAVKVVEPTREDLAAQAVLDASRAAAKKAKDAGLTDEEINALRGRLP